MAKFSLWYPLNHVNEGEWVNDPEDPGDETYRGVARRWWSMLFMWTIIDAAKDANGIFRPALLKSGGQEILDQAVKDVARMGYWNRILGDLIPNQSIADVWADSAYLDYPNTATEMMQRALNKLNNRQKLYPDIGVDGGVGPITIGVLTKCLGYGRGPHLMECFKSLRTVRYMELMELSEYKEKYIGWFSRVASFEFRRAPLAA